MNPLDYPYIKLVHRSEEEKKVSKKEKIRWGKHAHMHDKTGQKEIIIIKKSP